MYHGLDNRFLYTAFRVESTFAHDDGSRKTVSGTGFFVKNVRAELCFITNRHVVDLAHSDRKYFGFRLIAVVLRGKAPSQDGLPDVDVVLTLNNFANFTFSIVTQNDIACLRPPQGSIQPPAAPIEWFIDYALLATRDDFARKLQICDVLAFPGYPPWYDKRDQRPILRGGTIASDPRYDYSWTDTNKGECLAYEAFSYGGSSGSPVFAVQTGPKPGMGISFPGFRDLCLIGINAGHLPAPDLGHSGISYLYKSYAIQELIDALS